MNLQQQLDLELNRLAVAGGDRLEAKTERGELRCEVLEVDSLACAFKRFEFLTRQLQTATVEEMKDLCGKLATRLTYLLEPLGLVESDAESCTLQMRSTPPSKDDNGTSYYEVVANRSGLSLCRFNKPKGSQREVIPATVTCEVFCRLVHDFDEVLT